MRRISRHPVLTTFVTVFLSLLFALLPNTSAIAVVNCLGPAAYPPDLPNCLDPVAEARKVEEIKVYKANLKAIRTSKIAISLATDLNKVTNQVVITDARLKEVAKEKKALHQSVAATQQNLGELIKEFERTRIDILNYVATYNSAKIKADEAVQSAAEKKGAAIRSKLIVKNAFEAVQFATEKKGAAIRSKLIAENSFEAVQFAAEKKGAIIRSKLIAENSLTATNQTIASATDLDELKLLWELAVARYKQDQSSADIAAKEAEKADVQFQEVKKIFEDKVSAGKKLQEQIRTNQDQLAVHLQSITNGITEKNLLTSNRQVSLSLITAKLKDLSLAQVQARKAKEIADKEALAIGQPRNPASNLDEVVTANEALIEAAKSAALAVMQSNNSTVKNFTSKIATGSFAYLSIILSAVAITIAVGIFGNLTMRRYRRR